MAPMVESLLLPFTRSVPLPRSHGAQAVPFQRAAALMALAAALLLSHAARAMEEGGGWSGGSGIGGMGSGLPLMGHGGTARVHGVQTLDVEDYGMEFENDIAFMNEHTMNMQWLWDLQRDFDAWLDTLDKKLVLEDGIPMMNDGIRVVTAEEMDGVQAAAAVTEDVEDVAAVMEGVQDVAAEMGGVEDVAVEMDGEEVHQYDVLTAGEQVIFDVMFDIHHPNIYLDDNGFYRSLED